MTDETKTDEEFLGQISSGGIYIANPSDRSINRRSFNIARYAAMIEVYRCRGSNPDWLIGEMLMNISAVRGALDTMEKWAKMEKPE